MDFSNSVLSIKATPKSFANIWHKCTTNSLDDSIALYKLEVPKGGGGIGIIGDRWGDR